MLNEYSNKEQECKKRSTREQKRNSRNSAKLKARSQGDWDSRVLKAEPNPELMLNPRYWGAYCRGMYQRYLKKYNLQPTQWKTPVLQPLSKNSRRYAVNYKGHRIGIIKPGIGCWLAIAGLQYGAIESKLDNIQQAIDWLVQNYLRIRDRGIQFSVDESLTHYTIESGYWLIKIDVGEQDCLAMTQFANSLEIDYFPDLHSAVRRGFDLILNSFAAKYSSDEEF